jgi:hypothetical protein
VAVEETMKDRLIDFILNLSNEEADKIIALLAEKEKEQP